MVSFPTREQQTTGSLIAFPSSRRAVRETPKALNAYQAYAAMGVERSLAKLAETYGNPTSKVRQFQLWSSQHHWQERVAAYDAEQAEIKRKKRQDEIEKMDERHATFGRSSLFSVVQYLQEHFAAEATLADAIRLMKVAYELERLARGAATSHVDADVTVQFLPKEYVNISPDEEGSEP